MPNYDYQCQDCGCIVEFLGQYGEDYKTEICPYVATHLSTNPRNITEISGPFRGSILKGPIKLSNFTRIFSPSTNFILKGDGWAKDNYCKHKNKNKDKDEIKKKEK